jgi:arylsulfatase A-like enzyme
MRFRPVLQKSVLVAAIGAVLVAAGCDDDGQTTAAASTTPSTTVKRPNIVFIMADDLGYSDIHAFGGEIETPNLDALAASGRILTNHHTGTVCAITRSMLMSGTDHHLVGEGTMGAPSDERKGLPGYEGYLNDRALSMAQLLKDAGYHTYMAGKWHLGSNVAADGVALGSSGQTPDQWGFEQSYALLGGAATNHFAHEAAGSKNYTENGAYVQPGQPGQPGGTGGSPATFYSTDFYTQKLIADIDLNKADGKPFFVYAAYTSPHWPLQVPAPYLTKYTGKYDAGYDAVRDARIARQKALGLIPADFTPYATLAETLTSSPATAANGTSSAAYISAVHPKSATYVDYGAGRLVKKWSSLTALEQKAQARYMEIYAGMVDNLDHNIGLLVQHLKDIGEYDNTLIVFQSDNGAEGWPIGAATADPKAIDEANAVEPVYSALGTDNGLASAKRLQYGMRWAEVSATPFRQTKGHMGEGGVSTPLIVHLPGQTTASANLGQFTHVTDITATLLDAAGATLPTTPAPAAISTFTGVDANKGKVVYGDRYVYPVTGKSLLGLLAGTTTTLHTAAFGDESYGRAYLRSADGRWKALWTEPPIGPLDGHWELFDLSADRGENTDVSTTRPDILQGLLSDWSTYMSDVGGVEPLRPIGYY